MYNWYLPMFYYRFKGLVLPKMKIVHVLLSLKASYVYMNFFCQTNPIRAILKIILAVPSFIMAWTVVFVQQSKSSQIKCIYP